MALHQSLSVTATLIDRRTREPIRECTPEEIRLLIQAEPGAATHAVLTGLRDAHRWLCCGCGRFLHPVRAKPAFLRIHHSTPAPPPGLGCALCERSLPGQGDGGRGDVTKPEPEPALVLDTPTWIAPGHEKARHPSGRRRGEQYGSQRGLLRSFAEEAQWHTIQQPIHTNEVWRQLGSVLSHRTATLHSGGSVALSAITWLPDEPRSPASFARKIARGWPSTAVVPEMWMIAIAETSDISLEPSQVEFRIRDTYKREIRFCLDRDRVAWTICTPPHLVFAAGHAGKDLERWTPERVVVEGIVSPQLPVPVDSGEERRAVEIMRELGIAYVKCLFPVAKHIWPDFLLPERKLILEVQGTRRDGYAERKERTHDRMRAHYPGYNLLEWDVNEGATEEDLRRLLA